jgi:hypothetical protein
MPALDTNRLLSGVTAVESFFIIICTQYGCLAGTATCPMLQTNLSPACPSPLGYDCVSSGRYLPTRMLRSIKIKALQYYRNVGSSLQVERGQHLENKCSHVFRNFETGKFQTKQQSTYIADFS